MDILFFVLMEEKFVDNIIIVILNFDIYQCFFIHFLIILKYRISQIRKLKGVCVMKEHETFIKDSEGYLKKLDQLIPIVDRVHGGNHPEFHEVRELFDIILNKTNELKTGNPNLDEEFDKLREITANYKVPSDVCESYESVYNMLSKLDEIYSK